jgi:cysteinyl-tRNA synthetase
VALDSAESYIKLLISVRNQLREAKQWQLADEIRVELEKLGVYLEDTPRGTVWRQKR